MKTLKKFAIALFFAAAMGAVSTPAMAEDPGRIVYAPGEAIDMAISKVAAAIDALSKGEDATKVSDLAKEALDASKEINANDRVDAARSKANNKVKSARTHLKSGDRQTAEQELRAAEKGFMDLKGLM